MSNDIPAGWKITSLEKNAKLITDGAHFSPLTMEEGKPIATVQNMLARSIDISSCRLISDSDFESLIKGNCGPQLGDILFSKDGTVGKTFVYNQLDEIVLLSSIAIVRLIKEQLDPEFCAQFLLSPLFYHTLENTKSGSAIRRIVLSDLKKLELPKPPLPEQQKIATILSSVDDVIEKTRAQIDKLKDLKIGMMQELLTKGIGHTEFKDSPVGSIPVDWQVKTLGELADFWSGYAFKSSELSEQGMKVVRISNLHKPDFPYWRYDGKIKNTWVAEKGDVLFSWAGVANSINVHHYMGERALLNQHIYNFKFENDEIKFWVYQILKNLLPHLKANIEGGAGQLHLTKPFIQAIAIPMPQQDERAKIAGILEAIDSRINAIEAKVTEVTLLKKALMQDLLTGKVRVNLTDKESAVV